MNPKDELFITPEQEKYVQAIQEKILAIIRSANSSEEALITMSKECNVTREQAKQICSLTTRQIVDYRNIARIVFEQIHK